MSEGWELLLPAHTNYARNTVDETIRSNYSRLHDRLIIDLRMTILISESDMCSAHRSRGFHLEDLLSADLGRHHHVEQKITQLHRVSAERSHVFWRDLREGGIGWSKQRHRRRSAQ